MDSLSKLMVRAFASGIGRKLAYVLVGFVVAAVGTCAKAEGTVNIGSGVRWNAQFGGSGYLTAADAVQSVVTVQQPLIVSTDGCANGGTVTVISSPAPLAGTAEYQYTHNSKRATGFCHVVTDQFSSGISSEEVPQQCPPNSTQNGTTCTCVNGFNPDGTGTQCVPTPSGCQTVANGLNASGAVLYAQGAGLGLGSCYGFCVMRGSIAGADASGRYLAGPFTTTGASCNGSGTGSDAAPVPPADKPKPGNCPGTVNGVAVPGGVPCSGGNAAPTPDKASGPDNTASSPAGTTAGTTGSNGQTVCTGGWCTTTTTTTTNNSNGTSTTGTGTETSPQSDFCAKNPGNPICKKDSEGSFGGTCTTGFVCNGDDPIQCAMATDQHIRACQLIDASTPLSQAGVAATTAGDRPGDHPGAASNRVPVVVDFSAQLDQTNPWATTCPADQVIPISFANVSSSFTIPWNTKLCEPMTWMGRVAIALTLILCARLLSRSV